MTEEGQELHKKNQNVETPDASHSFFRSANGHGENDGVSSPIVGTTPIPADKSDEGDYRQKRDKSSKKVSKKRRLSVKKEVKI